MKKAGHSKRNSACVKIMASKENEIMDTPKLYGSLVRGGKQNVLAAKTNERK